MKNKVSPHRPATSSNQLFPSKQLNPKSAMSSQRYNQGVVILDQNKIPKTTALTK
jgi:hypothetical protein